MAVTEELKALETRLTNSQVPDKLKELTLLRLEQLVKLISSPTFLPEYDRMTTYIDWITSLPWTIRTEDNLDLENARRILDSHHFGLEEIKDRVLEFISIMKLKRETGESDDIYRAPVLCFVGLVGTGKTTIAGSIAEALGRKFARIPFGGMGDPMDLRGQSKMHAESEPGKIIKALREANSKNPVILLDELDRVTEQGRSSIMGVLVELLDPSQNKNFVDHYIDYPVDLSEVLFIATANNTQNISTAVMDRLEPISMPSYTDIEKITIAAKYVLPRILTQAGLSEDALKISDDAWPMIVRPLGYDSGIRTLERNIEGIVRKVARLIVEGKGKTYTLTPENIKEFLPQW